MVPNQMTDREAFKIVLELAQSAMITEADSRINIDKAYERKEQKQAVQKVKDFFNYFDESYKGI